MDSPPVTPLSILFRDSTPTKTYQDAVWGRVFNHLRDYARVPYAVCRPRTVSQVVDAVSLAVRHSRQISIRSGGHSWAAWSVRRDALLIDLVDLDADVELSPPPPPEEEKGEALDTATGRGLPEERCERRGLTGRIDYDPQTKIVSCPPATTGRMLNEFLAAVPGGGRMFMGGHCPDVGLGGFLLQGGMGWNCKNWGWACESITAIDVVTADGRVLHCDVEENADLFWLARGSGPGFPAIVTRFYLLTRPLLEMWHSLYVFPISAYRRVMQWEVEIAPTVDPSIEMVGVASYMALPPPVTTSEEETKALSSPSPPSELEAELKEEEEELTFLANFTTFQPTLELAEAALRPIHNLVPSGARISLFCEPTSFEKEYVQQAKTYPQTWRYCSDNVYLSNNLGSTTTTPGSRKDTTADEMEGKNITVVDVLESAFTSLPGAKSTALWFSMNPTSRRPFSGGTPSSSSLPTPMALSQQSDHYVALYTVWEDPRQDGEYTGWVRDRIAEMEACSTGSYLGDADFRHRFGTSLFWSREAGQKMMELRRKWDPEDRICGFLC